MLVKILNSAKTIDELVKLIPQDISDEDFDMLKACLSTQEKYITIDIELFNKLNTNRGHFPGGEEVPKIWDKRFEKSNEELWNDAARRLKIEGYV